MRGLQAGAKGYLLKDATSEEMLDAVRKMHEGRRYISTAVAAKLVGRLNSMALTDCEL